MNGKEFNHEILNHIQNEMAGQAKMVFKYRHGLADGIWYRLDEICDFLRSTTEECERLLRIGMDEVCQWLSSECERTAGPDPMGLDFLAIAGENKSPSGNADLDAKAVVNAIRETSERHGYAFDPIGISILPGGVFARIVKDGFDEESQFFVVIEPQGIRRLSRIVAILFRHRNELGHHSGGSHMAVLGCALDFEGVAQQPILVDVELFDTPFVYNWTVEAGLRASPSVEEPWHYRPFSEK